MQSNKRKRKLVLLLRLTASGQRRHSRKRRSLLLQRRQEEGSLPPGRFVVASWRLTRRSSVVHGGVGAKGGPSWSSAYNKTRQTSRDEQMMWEEVRELFAVPKDVSIILNLSVSTPARQRHDTATTVAGVGTVL